MSLHCLQVYFRSVSFSQLSFLFRHHTWHACFYSWPLFVFVNSCQPTFPNHLLHLARKGDRHWWFYRVGVLCAVCQRLSCPLDQSGQCGPIKDHPPVDWLQPHRQRQSVQPSIWPGQLHLHSAGSTPFYIQSLPLTQLITCFLFLFSPD